MLPFKKINCFIENVGKLFVLIKKYILTINGSATFVISYMVAITTGTLLLKAKWATIHGSIAWVDALFTATSAVCVTGLTVVDTGTFFTRYGQIVILSLIQLGGIGIMTFAVFVFQSAGWRISTHHRSLIQESYSSDSFAEIKKLVYFIIIFTAAVESAGTLSLMIGWKGHFSFSENFYYSLFHSVSAFCNAGFSLFPDSLIKFYDNIPINICFTTLIILGGLGFPVIYELWSWLSKPEKVRFSLHTKIVVLSTAVLILVGMVVFWLIEKDNIMLNMPPLEKFLVSYFQSVTARTAGFCTVNFDMLSNATLLIIIILMFIGASPGSCGGGIKTTSIATLFIVMWNRLRRREANNVFKRSLSTTTVSRTITIFIASVLFIIIMLCPLLINQLSGLSHEKSRGLFLEYLFETVSAFGTVGLSMGATARIGAVGKILITCTMFVGRIGILMLLYLIAEGRAAPPYCYAEENVMIG